MFLLFILFIQDGRVSQLESILERICHCFTECTKHKFVFFFSMNPNDMIYNSLVRN